MTRDITTTKPTMRGRTNTGQGTSPRAGKPMTIKKPGRPAKATPGHCVACYHPHVPPGSDGLVYCDQCRAGTGKAFHVRMVAKWRHEVETKANPPAPPDAQAKAASKAYRP